MTDEMIITVRTEDGGEIACSVISAFDSDRPEYQGRKYIALLPKTEQADEIILYAYKELPGDEIELLELANDLEYQAALELFDSLMDEAEIEDRNKTS